MSTKLKIIVTGLVGLYPVGGVAWDYFQYVIGLLKLGHDVYYHEDTWSWPYQPVEKQNTSEAKYSVEFIRNFFDRYLPELKGHWHYLHLHKDSFGMTRIQFDRIAKTADLFINISGNCLIPENLSSSCIKVFLDSDPGYNQIMLSEKLLWSENVEQWVENVRSHDQYFTYAENIHGLDCIIPKLDLNWKTTRMPIVMDLWKDDFQRIGYDEALWTTIMTWNAFKGKLIYRGKEYKSKDAEFEKIKGLPGKCSARFEIGVGGKNAPVNELRRNGWQVIDGPEATLTPEKYHNFILSSRGEFSIAKNVYVEMKTGWFSCRSICYMAAGKPVVLQDTGFSRYIPTGKGVIAFSTLDEAVEAIKNVESDYEAHCQAARQIAKEYFSAEVVLKDLLNKIGLE
jgi:hypothetical protein